MKKFIFTSLCSVALPFTAQGLTCLDEYAGEASCADSDTTAGDCKTLGYSTNDVDGCIKYLKCPFDTNYQRCVAYEDGASTECCEFSNEAICKAANRHSICQADATTGCFEPVGCADGYVTDVKECTGQGAPSVVEKDYNNCGICKYEDCEYKTPDECLAANTWAGSCEEDTNKCFIPATCKVSGNYITGGTNPVFKTEITGTLPNGTNCLKIVGCNSETGSTSIFTISTEHSPANDIHCNYNSQCNNSNNWYISASSCKNGYRETQAMGVPSNGTCYLCDNCPGYTLTECPEGKSCSPCTQSDNGYGKKIYYKVDGCASGYVDIDGECIRAYSNCESAGYYTVYDGDEEYCDQPSAYIYNSAGTKIDCYRSECKVGTCTTSCEENDAFKSCESSCTTAENTCIQTEAYHNRDCGAEYQSCVNGCAGETVTVCRYNNRTTETIRSGNKCYPYNYTIVSAEVGTHVVGGGGSCLNMNISQEDCVSGAVGEDLLLCDFCYS